jgi:hypothetical protein
MNGVSFVAAPNAITQKNVSPLVHLNANYAAIMPFGFVKALEHPEIIYNTKRQWFGETSDGAKQYVAELRKQNVKIMLKPQIWVWNGEFTGLIKMNSEANWKTFEASYSKFILDFARLAQELDLELLCIGTELEQFVVHRPEFWNTLITEIKKVYKGKLTYAANWDEFKRTPFWADLDFIGIDAYFPVSDSKTPTVEDCLKGWELHKPVIKSVSETYKKQVVFTEFGYRSVDFTGKEPWKSDRSMNQVNLEGQNNATKALFETFWKEDWFYGGFIWKWFHNYENSGGEENTQFTPQNKPVETIIKEYYTKFK